MMLSSTQLHHSLRQLKTAYCGTIPQESHSRFARKWPVHIVKISAKKTAKTYNSGDSPMVTHLTTSPPLSSLCMAERTGSPILLKQWSYVKEEVT